MIAVYPGSFDPVTCGHLDIIQRAAKMADRLIVAVLNNPAKTPMFNVCERLEMLKSVCEGIQNVEIASFEGLLVDFAKSVSAQAIIRGVRDNADFNHEFQMAQANKALNPQIETLIIPSNPKYFFLSSSLVKEVAFFGGNWASMVPSAVHNKILQKINTL